MTDTANITTDVDLSSDYNASAPNNDTNETPSQEPKAKHTPKWLPDTKISTAPKWNIT